MANKNILLIEPRYKNKYPPLGLMKIAQYHGPEGKKDNVTFVKGEDPSVFERGWDRIYVTSLFSFEWARTADSIDYAISAAGNQTNKVFVGGIAASLMRDAYVAERRWRGVRFIKGLLTGPPAAALQLDDFMEELYSDDLGGTPIEDFVPDYSILDQIEYEYPVNNAYFTYASRGCVRNCKFCGVPALEGAQRDAKSITEVVEGISKRYGQKKDLILMDNNVVASNNFRNIIAEIRDLGFASGAQVPGTRVPILRRVDFNQGVDARILCRSPMYLKELSTICIDPLRIAFDHWGLRKPYEQAIEYSANVGLSKLSNYMLYNFKDSPRDLYERMRFNIGLNERLDIRIFSFPMRYQPVNLKDRSHIGDSWNRYYLRSLQLVLQATHGVVSGAPAFFRRAFGATPGEFEELLMRPHHFIFNRDWYEKYDGRPEFESFQAKWKKLADSEKREVMETFSALDPRFWPKARFKAKRLRDVGRFYLSPEKDELREIWTKQKERQAIYAEVSEDIPADERVEDADLELAV